VYVQLSFPKSHVRMEEKRRKKTWLSPQLKQQAKES
jgi:hypothetical protein